MSKIRFTESEITVLSKNPNVLKISEKAITYSDAFKELFITETNNGKSSYVIFEEAGFDIDVLGKKRIVSSSSRWKKQALRFEGLKDTRTTASGNFKKRVLTPEEELEKLKMEVEYLKLENEFLKKIKEVERLAMKKTK